MTAVATGAPSRGRIAIASCIGTAIEFYDFYIYGTAAALVFGTLFFPSFSATAGTLAALATFAVGFIARPLGAVVFGHFGDRLGRKRMLTPVFRAALDAGQRVRVPFVEVWRHR